MSDDITTRRWSQLDRIMQAVEWVETEKYTRAGTELVAAANLNQTQPEQAWHDRPTVPGRWMDSRSLFASSISQDDIDKNRPGPIRWFGPIPQDPKGHE